MSAPTVGGLFDGCGLLAYGLHLAGLRHEWLCEVKPERRAILERRWPGVRVYDDVRAVGADAVRVDIIAGGFPCKGASTAGKRNGFEHAETVLWREMARAIGELRPRYVLVENVANLLAVRDGAVWGEVLGDLAALGFDVAWDCIPAAAFGAPHLRDRVIAVATHSASEDERPIEPARFRGNGRPGVGRGDQPPADTERDAVRQQSVAVAGSRGQAVAGRAREAAADTERERRATPAVVDGERGLRQAARTDGRGVQVDWLDFEPAIRRWEAVHGPAPEPLLRGVDDGRTVRVERSRLSALGDGVQVQLGLLVGEHIMSLEDARLRPQGRDTH